MAIRVSYPIVFILHGFTFVTSILIHFYAGEKESDKDDEDDDDKKSDKKADSTKQDDDDDDDDDDLDSVSSGKDDGSSGTYWIFGMHSRIALSHDNQKITLEK